MSSASSTTGLSSRAQLRWRSISWALVAGLSALSVAGLWSWLAEGSTAACLEAALRSGGCGLFYGLLAFHLQRVDPGDSHLQAGLVGAVCGIRSLGAASELPPDWTNQLAQNPSTVMMGLIRGWLPLWLPLWMPLIGSALALHALQHLAPRLLPAPRP
ncbi:MAG: hypothetical protein EBZ76_05625 [Synechococcaceae bacterium WB9_2_170]|nr:hypothetical protein [Synechococcaceae bacterium WB9_2_170]